MRRGRFGPQERQEPQVRINERIRISPVRLIDENGQQVGVVPVEQAREAAREKGLDLVEVAPDARPPVCRIMDYGRFRYEQQKKAQAARKKQHQVEVKQIKYRPAIDDHDFETKTSKVRKFLEEGHKVRVTVMFRRRDMRRPENGEIVLDRVIEAIRDVGQPEDRSRQMLGRDLSVTIFPLKKRQESEAAEAEA
ncbi:MAG: translation initiation factor IF-3 [Acidobacteria bacterium]|nr:MAG: translation initiation factor IF-3 [Acidobacteriota bacterium]